MHLAVLLGIALLGFTLVSIMVFLLARYRKRNAQYKLEQQLKDHDAATRLLFESIISGDVATLRVLLRLIPKLHPQFDVNRYYRSGSYLCLAARTGQVGCLEVLLEHGADVCGVDGSGETPLHLAARNGRVACLEVLLRAGAPLESRNGEGWTPLTWTAVNGRDECFTRLVAAGACVNVRADDMSTPLHYAAMNGHPEILRKLVEAGHTDVDPVDIRGDTPLHAAAHNGSTNGIAVLIGQYGANALLRNNAGETALQKAVKRGRKDFAAALVDTNPGQQLPLLLELLVAGAMDHPETGAAVTQTTYHIAAVPRYWEFMIRELSDAVAQAGMAELRTGVIDSEEGASGAMNSPTRTLALMRTLNCLLQAPTGDAAAAPAMAAVAATHLSPLWEALDRILEATQPMPAAVAALARNDSVCPLIEAFWLVAKATPETMGSDEKSPQAAFFRFIDKHAVLLRAMIKEKPEILLQSFDFFFELSFTSHPSFSRWGETFRDVGSLLVFDQKRDWLRQRLFAEQARYAASSSSHNAANDADGVDNQGGMTLVVDRREVLHASCAALVPSSLKSARFDVRFAGEVASGPGVRREWFRVVAMEMFNPNYGLFMSPSPESGAYHPNPQSHVNNDHLSFFRFVGRVVGLAIYHDETLDVRFSRAVYKFLLRRENDIGLDDLASVDPTFHRNLSWLLNNRLDDAGLGLTFVAEADAFGRLYSTELVPGGARIAVTDANKADYVRRVAMLRLVESVRQQLDALRLGFADVIPPALLAPFTEAELELLIAGLPQIDVADWRNNTMYTGGYDEQSPQVVWFWEVVEATAPATRTLLFSFATGSSRVPLGGFAALHGAQGPQKFTIMKGPAVVAGETSPPLPTASTCFNLLKLPEYQTKEQLEKALLTAISFGASGFSFG